MCGSKQRPEPTVPINKTVISSFLAVCSLSASVLVKIYDRGGESVLHLNAISTDTTLKAKESHL